MPAPDSAAVEARRLRVHIGGWRGDAPAGSDELRNPADIREIVAIVPGCDRAAAEEAIVVAASGAAVWAGASALERGRVLARAAALVEERSEELATAMTLEMGKVIAESRVEVQRTVEILRFFSQAPKLQDGATFPLAGSRESAFTLRVPLGTVGLITPWNFPLMIPAWKTAAALAFGNAVVLKPAALAPLSATALVECLLGAGLPAEAISLVPGQGSVVGAALVESERVAAISFTGSTEVGTQIARRAAEPGKRVQCEMGGRNALVVLADADLEAAVESIVLAGFGSAGQRCTSSSRVIVQRAVAEELTERLVAAVRELRVGPGLDPASMVGPVVSAAALRDVEGALARASREGAEILVGGGRYRGEGCEHGHFLEPTVTRGSPPDGWFAGHEVFGPVVSLIEADDLDEAIRLNNSVRYGLSSGIYTRDLEAAMRFVHETDTGMVHVNRPTVGAEPHIPFGGAKESSIGPPEMGDAWQFFTRSRSAHVRW
ncbi:MAG: aldehyde dehydrogenase family protein [Syntrophothermus sp.]